MIISIILGAFTELWKATISFGSALFWDITRRHVVIVYQQRIRPIFTGKSPRRKERQKASNL